MGRAASLNESRVERFAEALLVASGTEYLRHEPVEGVTVPDFVVPRWRVAIFVDGDYWHTNPRAFPNGPATEIQRINLARDTESRAVLVARGWTVVRIWEWDLKNDPVGVARRLASLSADE
jgi:DNA mismatch endonuclease (patch repair protein)